MEAVNFGIDLGTTNSLIAQFENGKVSVFKNPIGHKETLASVVAFRKDQRILVGDKAREYLSKDPINVFGSFKRKMGTDERYYVVNMDENVTPIELSSLVLKELKNFIHNNHSLEAAIITIPASFDTMQSNATQKAGYEAGIKTVFLLQEPIAASLAYFNDKNTLNEESNGYWLVYDLGGGTFDVALVSIKEGNLKVEDHEGNNFLGGVDFDYTIVEQILAPVVGERLEIEDFAGQLRQKNSAFEHVYHILMFKAEEAKKELSVMDHTYVEFSFEHQGAEHYFEVIVTKEQFESLIQPEIGNTISMIGQILERNKLTPAQINQIVLVGGSTYIPYVRNCLSNAFSIPVNTDVDPTTAVAVGAAYYAANKYYEPTAKSQAVDLSRQSVDSLLNEMEEDQQIFEEPTIRIQVTYNKTTREEEEVLLVKVEGPYLGYTYRITRKDGGFDTGQIPLKGKFTEFLPLLPNVTNLFQLKIWDENGDAIDTAIDPIEINHGSFNIEGQPLPKDICLEVDDSEHFTTKLEPVFERNSILPQKKTLYREMSRTIQKGSNEKIVINILEGDRYARAASNLAIGVIEISGKDLKSDLLKGSDIEIQITMDESRQLKCKVFLVMTEQEFENVFSISEKQISIPRLKEQFYDLEKEMRKTVKSLDFNENDVWALQGNQLLEDLTAHKKDVDQLKETDRTDKKYIIAETMHSIAAEFDKLGGAGRLEHLRSEYFETRDFVEQQINNVDFEKDALHGQFQKMIRNEEQLLRTRNSSILDAATKQMNRLGWDVLYNTIGFLIGRFGELKNLDAADFVNYNGAKQLFSLGEDALNRGQYASFRQHVISLMNLKKRSQSFQDNNRNDFKGTGIG